MCNCGGIFKRNIRSAPPKQSTPNISSGVDMKSRILALWKGVLSGETYAKAEFVRVYLQRFPNNKHLTEVLSNENLHTMYMQLTH